MRGMMAGFAAAYSGSASTITSAAPSPARAPPAAPEAVARHQAAEFTGKGGRGPEAAALSAKPAKDADVLQLVEDSAHNLLIGASSQEEVLQRGFSPVPASG